MLARFSTTCTKTAVRRFSTMSVETLTLYTAKVCPFAHRTEIALAQAGTKYKRFEIDLQNKPEWYAPKVNPASKVPAIAYGGPDVSPDQPSPESTKIAESLILVEFVADLFPNAGILPTDPVQRAQARFFVDQVNNKFSNKYAAHVVQGAPAADLIAGAEAIQALLPADKKFALGDDFTVADIAIAPFLLRAEIVFGFKDPENVLSTFQSEKLARFWKYYQDLKAHPHVQSTFDTEYVKSMYAQRFGVKQ